MAGPAGLRGGGGVGAAAGQARPLSTSPLMMRDRTCHCSNGGRGGCSPQPYECLGAASPATAARGAARPPLQGARTVSLNGRLASTASPPRRCRRAAPAPAARNRSTLILPGDGGGGDGRAGVGLPGSRRGRECAGDGGALVALLVRGMVYAHYAQSLHIVQSGGNIFMKAMESGTGNSYGPSITVDKEAPYGDI